MAEKCDKCGGKTTKGRHHKHCRACVNCTVCGWSNTHDMMFKDWRTPSGASMGYGAESFSAEELRSWSSDLAYVQDTLKNVHNYGLSYRHPHPDYLADMVEQSMDIIDSMVSDSLKAESFGAEDCSICGGVYGDYICECDVPRYAESFDAELSDNDWKQRDILMERLGKKHGWGFIDDVSDLQTDEKEPEYAHNLKEFKAWVSNKYSAASSQDVNTMWDYVTLERQLVESFEAEGICICGSSCNCDCGCAESGVCNCGPSCPCSCGCGVANAESFEAEGNPKKTTSTLYAKFYVGHTDKKGELAGNGKFKSYDDALAKAKEVAKKEGHSRIVSTRGFALWTSDGQGLFQAGKSTAEAKKFYRAEDGSIDMNGYATEYMEAEDGFFEAVGDDYRTSMKRSNPLSIHYIPPGSPVKPTRPSDDRPSRRRPFKRPIRRPMNAHEDIEIQTDIQAEKAKHRHQARKERGIGFRRFLKLGKHRKGAEGAGIRGGRNRWVIGEMIMAGVLVVGYLNYMKKSS